MSAAAVVRVEGASRRRGSGADGFRLEVPSFLVDRGECVALTGPSGCGKSTMLDLLGLVLRPDTVDAFLLCGRDGTVVDVGRMWRQGEVDRLAAIRAVGIGYVLQTGGLLPFLRAADNVRLSRTLLGLGDSPLIGRLVEALGIGHLLAKKPRALSIGERQRVAIARALAHEPMLLLADEPTAALDPTQAVRVMELLLSLVRELDVTAVVVTHDWELVRSLGLREVRATVLAGERGSATRFSG
jgi:putative ABC transport system ATP-binding protein